MSFCFCWSGGLRSRRLLGRGLHRSFRLGRLGLRAHAILDREDHLTDFDLLSFFDANLFYRAGHGRRDFDHRLVSFQFHHWLAFSHVGARRNHQADKIALVNVLAEFRQLEFCH